VTIAGAPAVLSACVALCLPGMAAHHVAPAVEASATACAEHVAAAVPVPADAQLSGTAAHCCGDGLTVLAASSTAPRVGTHPPVAAVAPLRVSWTAEPKRPAFARRHDPAAPPPSPPRTSAVLRI
jgi:hypothetical protein